MTLPPLLNPTFWFDTTPPPFVFWIDRTLAVVTIALTVAGIAALLYGMRAKMEKEYRAIVSHVGTSLFLTGLVGLLLYFFTLERIPYLSLRAFWIAWLFWIAWEAWKVWKTVRIDMPAAERARVEREKFTKWLPKKKN